jgi:hypothetical protein
VIITSEDRARRRRLNRYSWGGGVAAAVLAVLSIHLWVRPLDVVWQIVLRRLGV